MAVVLRANLTTSVTKLDAGIFAHSYHSVRLVAKPCMAGNWLQVEWKQFCV